MKKTLTNIFVVIGLLAITASVCSFCFRNTPSTCYVNLGVVFEKFDYKLELERKLLKVTEARKHIIDSLQFELDVLARQIKSQKQSERDKIETFEVRKQFFLQKREEFEEDNSRLVSEFDEQILKQMTQYVKDFGIEHDLDYVLGVDGNGTVLYAEESKDITNEVVEYINKKYKGIQ